MSQELYSVEQVAQRLGLHVRTVRAYIRDGRLKAVRIGKQYRVARGDLEALTGKPAEAAAGDRRIEVSAIVEMEGVGLDASIRLANALTGALNSRKPGDPPLRAETIFDPERRRMKFILLGDPAVVGDLLKMLTVWSDAYR
ncbi:MAG TPA: helix-turn-helix domain-containing protein [Phenylobacterium sp.]|nr:helix-turn-helix domain-containing protein [Phenylobacterium sp.]